MYEITKPKEDDEKEEGKNERIKGWAINFTGFKCKTLQHHKFLEGLIY